MNNEQIMNAGYRVRLDWTQASRISAVQLAHTFPTTADAVKGHLVALMQKHDLVAVEWLTQPGRVILCDRNDVCGVEFYKDVWHRHHDERTLYIGRRGEIEPDSDHNSDWWQEVEHFCVGEHVFLLD